MQAIILNGITVTRARVVTVRTNAREIDGISKAVLIEQLKNKLKSGNIVKFAYLKSNGEVRIAFGTTNPDFVKDKVCGWGESRESYATTAYFDLEKCDWRSFRWENLIAVF
ncbi:SH3 beta-barrel fold-containing protein [Bacteroides fragilis]|jgi:hypothetical protein|uniref:SH3 beta-barrel fold-containing protein n=1 Tax=Bacteroides fragilis TaxID=817 RepID=UPI0022AAFD83|nr:SH3 beta-barrel fold-containing protein [Bacteroides fragilis]MCZ2586422.1 SH3 beta-barrel fold-containing protein [Bacteroides fragilis]